MAQYKPVCSINVYQGASKGDRELITLLNELASLLDDSVNATCRRLLREVLPPRIAALRQQVKKEVA